MKISLAKIICDICHARTPTIKDNVFLDERKKTNQYKNKQTKHKKKNGNELPKHASYKCQISS